MAVIVSKEATTLDTANGFYQSYAYNVGVYSNISTAFGTTNLFIPLTFSSASNCKGVILSTENILGNANRYRQVIVDFEQADGNIASFDPGTNTITKVAHGYLDNQALHLATTGALPTNLVTTTRYYVINKTDDTFQLSETLGGAVRTFTGTGSGTASVWKSQREVIKDHDDIGKGNTTISNTAFKGRSSSIIPWEWSSVIAVDTNANKWRIALSEGDGAGSANIWKTRFSSAGNIFFVTYSDTQVSFTDNDTVVMKNKVVIDKTASFGGLAGTGNTDFGVACIICSNLADIDDEENLAYFEWENAPAASYTLTLKGNVVMTSFSAMRIGSATKRIPFSKRAILNFTAPDVGTTTPRIHTLCGNFSTSYVWLQYASLFFYGEIPTYQKTNLSTDAAINQKVIEVVDDVDWVHGDALLIGKQDIRTDGVNTTPHNTIDYVTGKVTGVTIHTAGTDYEEDDILTINTGGTNCTVKVETVDEGGEILTVSIVNAGTGYVVANELGLTGGSGSDAKINITTVAGKTITLNENVATRVRKGPTTGDALGGTVMVLNKHGVNITSDNSARVPLNYIWGMANVKVSGVDFYNTRFTGHGNTTHYFYLAYLDSDYRSQFLFQDCTSVTESTSQAYLASFIPPPDGVLMQRVYTFRHNLGDASVALSHPASGFLSGRLEYKDCVVLSHYSGVISTNTIIRLTFENCRFENSRNATTTYYLSYVGRELIAKNNYFWGNGSTTTNLGCVQVRQAINVDEISGNVFENNTSAMYFTAAITADVEDEDCSFVNNVGDIAVTANAFPDYTFLSPKTASIVIDESLVTEMVDGSRIGFTNFNEVTGEDLSIFVDGKIRKTGTGLSDTTARTNYAMRFYPTNYPTLFSFSTPVPTGNIKGKTMAITVWCKIKKAEYWAYTNRMPELRVRYDGTKTSTATATETTEWQQLSVVFTPTTEIGQIYVRIAGTTSAYDSDPTEGHGIEEDAYFYFDDFSILYPAGYQLDLGGVDIWYNALPIMPPIATNLSAADVWAVATSVLTGSGTIGKEVVDIKKDTGLIPALL